MGCGWGLWGAEKKRRATCRLRLGAVRPAKKKNEETPGVPLAWGKKKTNSWSASSLGLELRAGRGSVENEEGLSYAPSFFLAVRLA